MTVKERAVGRSITDFEQRAVARAVESICSANESACRRILGQGLENLEPADRRGEGRNKISLPFYLFPVSPSELDVVAANAAAPPLIAVTQDLSTRGVGFRSDTQVPMGQLIAEFDALRAGRIRLLLEIRWRRRQSLHCYLAGARILSVLTPDSCPAFS